VKQNDGVISPEDIKTFISKCNDGKSEKVTYDDFSVHIKEKEKSLWDLFLKIDLGNDMKICKKELRIALQSDGTISFINHFRGIAKHVM
jgi:Ca2+-binding EF-hand superfamily protein